VWPARAFPIAENVEKVRLQIINCRFRIFPNYNKIDLLAACGKFVDQFDSSSFLNCAGLVGYAIGIKTQSTQYISFKSVSE